MPEPKEIDWSEGVIPGKWQHHQTEVELNEVGKSNGVVRSWIDGKLVIEKSDFEFRTISSLGIDRIKFNVFFGGNTPEWAPPKDELLYIDNFTVTESVAQK